MLILHCFTQLICVGFYLNMLVCHLRLFPQSSLDHGFVCTCWAGIKIGPMSCWGMGVFVLELSNINIVAEIA